MIDTSLQHIGGRRHRRFALDSDNWKELDKLLEKLIRPPKSSELDCF